MKRIERVRKAILHQETDAIPSCIHLDGDAQKKYFDRLFERYVKGDLLEKYQERKPTVLTVWMIARRLLSL